MLFNFSNNFVGFNLKLNSYYRVWHPGMWIFISTLQKFHQSVLADIVDINQGKEIHPPRKVWQNAEARKKRVVTAFDHRQYIQFLENVADTLIL